MDELATKDYVRDELRDMMKELLEELNSPQKKRAAKKTDDAR
jgi:hypothetical protein